MDWLISSNSEVISLSEIPVSSLNDLVPDLELSLSQNCRVLSFFALPRDVETYQIIVVVGDYSVGELLVSSFPVGPSYQSLTPRFPQLHMFEREVFEQYGIEPLGHPWLKPVRFQPALPGALRSSLPPACCGVADYFRILGSEEHEVAVGPVHAGIIEPGHFRFQCHGEIVHHLEISLGYQHRGIERALLGGPTKRTMFQMETLAGDTTIGHAWAYAQAIEALCGSKPSDEAQIIRAIALELERLANHTGDLGALGQDVGYLPTSSYNGRIRGDFLNMTALICGSRLGRNLVRPGGVLFGLERDRQKKLVEWVKEAGIHLRGSVELLLLRQSVLARFEHCGTVKSEDALALGLVGPAARASGISRDARQSFPSRPYQFCPIEPCVHDSGDVYARALVRWLEAKQSLNLVPEFIEMLTGTGSLAVESCEPLRPNSFVFSVVEGWRGEICHCAITDNDGRFARYKITDPSFQNWTGLAMALRDQEISDFPLNNKSFNLSYCGFDQ